MKSFFIIVFTFCSYLAHGQTTFVGNVMDEKGLGIPFANIFIQDTYDGTSSDANGNFKFSTSETGEKILVVKFVGFKEYMQAVVPQGDTQSFRIILKEEINELEAVTISAGSFTASDQSRRTVFRAVDIATTAGATADIAGALNTLPGTQKVGESGRLFVRGGDGNEARTFIDGMLVLDAYGPSAPNTPSRGRFLPFMFKGTSFSTGGYSSEYGQALSSALVLDSKDKAELTRTDIGILSVGGDVGHTQVWSTGSVAGKIQYTNIRPYFGMINQEIDWKTPPASVEGSSAFRQQIGKDGMIKFFGNFNYSNFSLYQHDIDNVAEKQRYDLTNKYRYMNGFYRDALSSNWMVRGGISYTSMKNLVAIDGFDIAETESGIHLKTVLEGLLSDKVELKTGAEIIRRNYNQDFGTTSFLFEETIAATFIETDIYTSNNFVTRTGARVEYNDLQKKLSLDPRVSLAYKTGINSQVALAYGIFRQAVKNEWLRINNNLGTEKAAHYILNYQRIENNKTFRIESFYKKYNDLVKFNSSSMGTPDNGGSGYARGIELFWRDNESLENTDYWLSYSLLDSKRDYLNFPYQATPSFVSMHNFSAVGKYFVQDLKSQLGMTYSFSSGRPFNNPNKTGFNTGKTPAYHDLSFNWSYLPKPYLIVYFSCTNVLGRDNIFGYEYGQTLNEQGVYNSRAIRQPARRFVFLGIFITISKDRSVNQLPAL